VNPNSVIHCPDFPCRDVVHAAYHVPNVEVDPEMVRVVLISEGAAPNPADNYDAPGDPLFARTTLLAFQDAGLAVSSAAELRSLGVYLTTAVKCAKTAYTLLPATVDACSRLLEMELDLFPNVRAWLLMGDAAIRAVNSIARRAGAGRVIPAGSTYKIRGQMFSFRGARAFPSYLQAGASFGIEKSKRRMIAEDIRAAMQVAGIIP